MSIQKNVRKGIKSLKGASLFANKCIGAILVSAFLFGSFPVVAQDNDVDQFVEDSKRDLMLVAAGGAAGAILGLSTLSFVDEPKKHTRNIMVGASLGIIAGVAFVAFTQADKSKELLYGQRLETESEKGFPTFARNEWHYENFLDSAGQLSGSTTLNYAFTY